MTGELTLTGLVLPVGGIREKVLAAKRAGVEELILPKRNEADVMEIPAAYREGLTFHFASRIDEVWAVALLPAELCGEGRAMKETRESAAAPAPTGKAAAKRPRRKPARKATTGRGGSAPPPV